jgi:hypothetical protein
VTGTTASTQSARLLGIERASVMLSVIPEKKMLIYFSQGTGVAGSSDQVAMLAAINAAKKANVAIFPVDISAATPAGRALNPNPADVPQAEYNRRVAYAQANFPASASAMSQTYIKYGPPDSIEDHGPNGLVQTWRYTWLENFHSSVEFELSRGKGPAVINWPPPLMTVEGRPVLSAPATVGLTDEFRNSAGLASTPIAGLPQDKHASVQVFPAGEAAVVIVPLEAFTGWVDVVAVLETRSSTGERGKTVGAARDAAMVAPGSTERLRFVVSAGSYVGSVAVRERSSGQIYTETMSFEVK